MANFTTIKCRNPACFTENEPGRQFCRECGLSLAVPPASTSDLVGELERTRKRLSEFEQQFDQQRIVVKDVEQQIDVNKQHVEGLERAHDGKIRDLAQAHEEKIKTLEDTHAQNISGIKEEHAQVTQTLKETYEKNIQKFKENIQELEKRLEGRGDANRSSGQAVNPEPTVIPDRPKPPPSKFNRLIGPILSLFSRGTSSLDSFFSRGTSYLGSNSESQAAPGVVRRYGPIGAVVAVLMSASGVSGYLVKPSSGDLAKILQEAKRLEAAAEQQARELTRDLDALRSATANEKQALERSLGDEHSKLAELEKTNKDTQTRFDQQSRDLQDARTEIAVAQQSLAGEQQKIAERDQTIRDLRAKADQQAPDLQNVGEQKLREAEAVKLALTEQISRFRFSGLLLEGMRPVPYDPSVMAALDKEVSERKDALAYKRRGTIWAQYGQFAQAIADFDEAIRLSSKDYEALNQHCWARAVVGDLETALKSCTEGLQLSPSSAPLHDSLGFVYLKRGDYGTALSQFEEALRRESSMVSALYGRGLAKIKTGNATGGNADIAAAKTFQPNIVEEFASYGIRE